MLAVISSLIIVVPLAAFYDARIGRRWDNADEQSRRTARLKKLARTSAGAQRSQIEA